MKSKMLIDNGKRGFKMKALQDLTFSDDLMFGAVMRNEKICKGVIERLLKIKIGRIEYPKLQKTIEPFYSRRGVRMDVYVEGSDKVFDVECQTYDEKSIGKRTRYYQSMIDADSLLKGQDYSGLKESYILFICLDDPFSQNLPVYTFNRICKENAGVKLCDESHIAIFNADAWKQEKDSQLKDFLEFVRSNKAQSDFTKEIEKMVEEKKFENTFINEYMAWNLHDRDVEKRAAARQKAEDEKLISRQATEIKNQANRIAELEALLTKSQEPH